MKLTIEHLSAYLPYDIKVMTNDGPQYICGLPDKYHIHYYDDNTECDDEPHISDIKPILRPLSDLTKEIEHSGKTFVPIVKLCEIFTCYECEDFNEIELTEFEEGYLNTINSLETLDYATAQKLLEWHVDLFELIENNLAIDINTI